MSKLEDFRFIPTAKQKIVQRYGGTGYRTVFLCPVCGQELRFIAKEVLKCPVCGNLIKKGVAILNVVDYAQGVEYQFTDKTIFDNVSKVVFCIKDKIIEDAELVDTS